jgi:molecular chaperone HtpG
MLSEEKFFEKAEAFNLFPTVDGKHYTYDELYNAIKAKQTDKDDKLVILYASDKDAQHSYIEAAKDKDYEVLLLDSPIVSHLIQKLETTKENISFVRVDADHIDNLIKKDDTKISKLSEDEKTKLDELLKEVIPADKFSVQLETMDSTAAPFMITQPEFMRRMKEMQQTGGGGMQMFGNMPEMYNLVVNTNSELVGDILNAEDKDNQERLINQSLDLARLSQGLLKGEALTNFIKRSYDMIK